MLHTSALVHAEMPFARIGQISGSPGCAWGIPPLGLGLFAPTTPELVSDIEAFFRVARPPPAMHEVSPLPGGETVALLADRGYRPIELSTVLVQDLEPPATALTFQGLHVRTIDPDDRGTCKTWIDSQCDRAPQLASLRPSIE